MAANSLLSFDFVCLLVVAGVLSALGLATNNTVNEE